MLYRFGSLMLALVVGGCSTRDGDPVHYVLPDGYRGPFVIIADGQDDGGYHYDGTKHVYSIPASGVLHVTTAKPIELDHRVSAEYVSGMKIYWLEPPPQKPADVRISGLGATGDRELWEAVGSEGEVDGLRRIWNEDGGRGLRKLLPPNQTLDQTADGIQR